MSRIRRVPPHAIALEVAKRAIKRYPHDPVQMESGCSTPPVFMWICPIPGCQHVSHTYQKLAPLCSGGIASAVTRIFDQHVWAGDARKGESDG